MGQFCDYRTNYAGLCGMWVEDGHRCKRHEGLKSNPKRSKVGHYSGDSKYREKHGYFQAKEGR